jgi:catechol 1,2-dioxygenase
MKGSSFDRRSAFRIFPAFLAGLSGARLLASERPCAATSADVPGPFYLPGAPKRTSLADRGEKGVRIRVRGTVYGSDCRTPLRRALLDVWQADAEGHYHDANEQYRLRGQILTDERGRYEFETVRPGNYKMGEGWRPAHIHFTISSPDHEPLTTQLYFRGDPYLTHDACGPRCHSDDPHRIVSLEMDGNLRAATFDVVLKTHAS